MLFRVRLLFIKLANRSRMTKRR